MLHSKAREGRSKATNSAVCNMCFPAFPQNGAESICTPHTKDPVKAGTSHSQWALLLKFHFCHQPKKRKQSFLLHFNYTILCKDPEECAKGMSEKYKEMEAEQ